MGDRNAGRDPEAARVWPAELSRNACDEASDAYWSLGDHLWTK